MKSFYEVYEQIEDESYEKLEKSRKKSQVILLISIIVCVAMVILIPFSLLKTREAYTANSVQMVIIIYVVSILLVLLPFIIKILSKSKYTPEFKEKVIGKFINNIDEKLKYLPEQGISSYTYSLAEFEKFDRFESEDLITGILDGKYMFQMSEVKTKWESKDEKGRKTSFPIFHGLFGNIQCPKSIKTTLKIRPDKWVFGKIFKRKTKVTMDSQEFEKYFDVYGDNKIIVMQILTAEVMAAMIDFRKQSKIKYELTIKDSNIFIRFHTGGVFEPGLFKNSLDYNMLKRYYDIIDFVFKVTREINSVVEKTDI